MDFAGDSPNVGGVIPEGQVVDICMALITKMNDAAGAVKYHKQRSGELAQRVQAIRPKLEEIQERGGLPQDQHGAAQNVATSLQRAVEVMERSTQSRLLRALQYASLKEELNEVWGDISTAIADLHMLEALEPHLPDSFPDELHEGLEFGDMELAFRQGLLPGAEFVKEVLQEREVTDSEKKGCHEEMAALLHQMESMSPANETLASRKHEQEAFLRQILPLLAPLDTAAAPSSSDGGSYCRTLLPGHLCSICSSPMLDPVMTEAGHSYCRGCISSWLATHNTDPNTNTPLADKRLFKNVDLKQALEAELKAMEPFASLPQEAWRAYIGSYTWEEGPAIASAIPPPRSEGRWAASAPPEPLERLDPLPQVPPHCTALYCTQTLIADSRLRSLAFASNGDLFSGHMDGSVSHWRDGALVAMLYGHTGLVTALAVAPDGSLFSGSHDQTVREWRRGQCTTELIGHTAFVTSLAVAADGSVYSGSADTTIRQWRGATCIAILQGHKKWVTALALAADGALFSGSRDGTIREWRNGECVATLVVPGSGQGVEALAVAPDGSLFSGGGDRFRTDLAIRQWREGNCVGTLEGHTNWVGALAVAPDGSLFSGSEDKTVRQWRDGRCEAVLGRHNDDVRALAVAHNGSLFSGSWEGTIRHWSSGLRMY